MKHKTSDPADGGKKQDVELNELEELNLPPEGEDTPEPPVNPREAMMSQIVSDSAEAREQAYIEEGLEPPGSGSKRELELPEELKELEDDLEDLEIIEPETVDNLDVSDDTQVVHREGQAFIKVKIDGVEQEVSVEDMVTHYQKNENADAKLGQANQLLSQARTIQQSSASTPPDDSVEPVVDENAVNAVFTKLYDGDVDEAAKDFSAIISKQTAPQVDIFTQVAMEVERVSDHKDLTSSLERFYKNDDFKQIANDPTLMSKVDALTVELQQDKAFMSTNPSYEDIFNEAGNRTNTWLEKFSPASSTEQILESRRDLKLAKSKIVNSRTARRGPKPDEKPPTREDNIAKMAKARGQTIY